MPTIEELQQKLSNETMMRVFGDNDVKNTIVNETVVRNEVDDSIKIKIANESTDRASKDTAILQKLSDEVQSRVQEIESLKRRIEVLEQIVGSVDNNNVKPNEDNKLMISQEMFVRQLNMLKRSAKFILENANVDQIAEDKDESVDFLIHLNNMQLTYDILLANKEKYTLTDETSKCIEEAESLKKQLEELSNNWDIEALFVDRQRRGDEHGCSDKRLKENIVLLGTTAENINVYQFNYIFDPMKVKHVGVIAQELLETEYKNNVYMHEDGFYRVDYKHLDMTFDGQLLPYLAK